jgi:uncharacterized Fe-S cluster-containing MiaB family protein
MTHKYFPLTNDICHHFYDAGGCLFCGYNLQKKTVSQEPISLEGMIAHFDNYAAENSKDIEKQGRLVVVPNGSWFTEVPKELRKHIYDYVDANMIPVLKYECRASLFNPEKAKQELGEEAYSELRAALSEIKPNHVVSLGLEVADDADLDVLNKGCTLEDYLKASKKIHRMGAKLCCNILISPPYIEEPVRKAFETAKYAAETLNAEEFLIMPCIPMKGAYSYQDWLDGKWDPISATAASEIYKIISHQYPNVRMKYNSMRVFNFHGRYGEFKRENRKWTDDEKAAERKKVRKAAEIVFP